MSATIVSERRVRDAYGASLLFVVVSVFVSIAMGDGTAGTLIVGLLQLLTLLAVLQVTQASARFVFFARLAGIVAALIVMGVTVGSVSGLTWVAPALWALIIVGVIVAIARHLRSYDSVTVQAVLGLVTVYVLLGLLFSYLFMLTAALRPGFFEGGKHSLADFVYFSYVTLATVGYGDLTAASGLPRALAVMEAILGQLYLVTVVALAVGHIGRPAHRDA